MMILGASRDELAGNNVRVLGHTRVHQGAVVIVGRTRCRAWFVGVSCQGDGRDRWDRARGIGGSGRDDESGDAEQDRSQKHRYSGSPHPDQAFDSAHRQPDSSKFVIVPDLGGSKR